MNKYIICCDFDGVLHSYTSGWKGASVILDPPVPGALDWLVEMTSDDNYTRFEIAVYSSRSKEECGIAAMQLWLYHYLALHFGASSFVPNSPVGARVHALMERLTFPTQKPAASMTIDDRAFCFAGTFPTTEWLLNFKPWNKK